MTRDSNFVGIVKGWKMVYRGVIILIDENGEEYEAYRYDCTRGAFEQHIELDKALVDAMADNNPTQGYHGAAVLEAIFILPEESEILKSWPPLKSKPE